MPATVLTVETFSSIKVPDSYIYGIDRRKIKKIKRKGGALGIIREFKLFSTIVGRYDSRGNGVLCPEFWIVPRESMTHYQLSSLIFNMHLQNNICFNKSRRLRSKYNKMCNHRNFIEIDPLDEDFTISNIKNPTIEAFDLFILFKDQSEYVKWKLTN